MSIKTSLSSFLKSLLCLHFGANTVSGKQVKEEEGSDDEDLSEAEEDESDLDLAWKMLDVARAIVEKHSGDPMQKVDILSTLAEVSLERGLLMYLCLSSFGGWEGEN